MRVCVCIAMSALLRAEATEINLFAEYGYSARDFSKQPRVEVRSEYKSCLLLVHHQSRALPNRRERYRNHFTLFHSNDSILVVRAETTLIHNDNDAVLLYDRIRVSPNRDDRMRASLDNWDVSFDRDIDYSNARPDRFGEYELVGSGEWWFFDRGVVLNGATAYARDVDCLALFAYYELHPKFMIRRVSRPLRARFGTADVAASVVPSFLYGSRDGGGGGDHAQSRNADGGGDHDSVNVVAEEEAAPVPNLNPRTMVSMLNVASRPVISANERVLAPDAQYRTVMPSLFWLKARDRELIRCDISYFLPKNYKCAYGPL